MEDNIKAYLNEKNVGLNCPQIASSEGFSLNCLECSEFLLQPQNDSCSAICSVALLAHNMKLALSISGEKVDQPCNRCAVCVMFTVETVCRSYVA